MRYAVLLLLLAGCGDPPPVLHPLPYGASGGGGPPGATVRTHPPDMPTSSDDGGTDAGDAAADRAN